MHIAVAEGAVGERHVAHEGMPARGDTPLQRVGDDTVGTERSRELALGLRARRRDLVEKLGLDVRASRASRRRQLSEGESGVGGNEQVDRIVAPGLRRIGVDLHERSRQAGGVVAGLVAAQARADHDHQVGAIVDRLRFRGHVEGAEGARMRLRHDGAAVGAASPRQSRAPQDRAPPCPPRGHRRRATASAAWPRARARPAHRAAKDPAPAQQWVRDRYAAGARSSPAARRSGTSSETGPRGARERGARGRFDHRNGGAALPYAEIGFGDRPQHVGLTRHVVDGGAVAIHVGHGRSAR